MSEVYIKHNRYGKELVKFMKKVVDPKDPKKHTAYEYTVLILLRGDFEESYTKEDNASVVPTDTMKNTVYVLAKTTEFDQPEVFAAIMANHFTSHSRFAHVSSAECTVTAQRWSRIVMSDGSAHPHSFYRDGEELRTGYCEAKRGGSFTVSSEIRDLQILKTTGSAFYGFFKDEYTTLPEVKDRIFSTNVNCSYKWGIFNNLEQIQKYSETFGKVWASARQITFETFATDNSCSVQATLYKMCEKIITVSPGVSEVEYTLPNVSCPGTKPSVSNVIADTLQKHYFEANLSPFNIANTGTDATVYLPQSWPSGHINACIARSGETTIA
ncbi:protein of unknown function [Taphrina deformans PYCC 5710]|uniref:Uricase n=1 Tax=Taphrina deformans (strain PYCC 5710 / ATCC 11124 / CBS 356.35 / IMI 108563 / JCM 9778 / NBRC 8474) TaxID=1097556 RepID=R4XN45_TAPDE|nr:protein of unknown function [Taphrina deformans PYCC 5710]|eukprot:CCG84664.1 protein of unknown function [Taphrina deformans PYCC 5710]